MARNLAGASFTLFNFCKKRYKGEQTSFSNTQILAMYMTKMKETAEKWCQEEVQDVVLSVPCYYDDRQRWAWIDASRIAGLTVMKLMNEGAAIALLGCARAELLKCAILGVLQLRMKTVEIR